MSIEHQYRVSLSLSLKLLIKDIRKNRADTSQGFSKSKTAKINIIEFRFEITCVFNFALGRFSLNLVFNGSKSIFIDLSYFGWCNSNVF